MREDEFYRAGVGKSDALDTRTNLLRSKDIVRSSN